MADRGTRKVRGPALLAENASPNQPGEGLAAALFPKVRAPYATYGRVLQVRAADRAQHSQMHFERIKTPGIAHVAYLIGNKGEAAVVDPRRDVDEYLKLARKHKLTIKYSIETHRQEDFVMGSAELARQCGAKVVNGRHKAFGHGDIRLDDGEAFEVAKGIRIVALHTPGHTPESMCYAVYLDDAPDHAWAVFTGDTLFIGEAGRTDLTDPSKTAEHAGQLYDAVHAKLLPLGDQTILLPAHGSGSVCGGNIAERDHSTIGLERRYNPVFVRSRRGVRAGQAGRTHPAPALLPAHGAGELEGRDGAAHLGQRRAGAAAQGLPGGVPPRGRVRPAPAGGVRRRSRARLLQHLVRRAARVRGLGRRGRRRRSIWCSTTRTRRWTMQ